MSTFTEESLLVFAVISSQYWFLMKISKQARKPCVGMVTSILQSAPSICGQKSAYISFKLSVFLTLTVDISFSSYLF